MKRSFCILTILSFIMISSCTELNTRGVSVEGRKILVNGDPYFIKGICYNPVAKGHTTRSFTELEKDLELMKEAGINTIRVYSPIDEVEVLDKIHAAGMKLIVGFGYNQNGHFDILSGTFIDYVKKYQSHPVIILWELGNEYNYHPEWFENDIRNWYTSMNNAAKEIHEVDSDHPVTTAHGELPDSLAYAMSPEIDVWGLNIYRWDNPDNLYQQWQKMSDKPMYLSEAGADSYMTKKSGNYQMGPNEKAQADATFNILNSIFDNKYVCSGVTLFAFVDELWKAGNPSQLDPGGWAPNSSGVPYDGSPNEEYWGILDIDRNKKEAFEIVKNIYNH